MLIMGSLALHWFGTAHFMGVTRPVWLFLLPPLVTLLSFPVFTYAIPSQPVRIVIVSVLGIIGCVDSGRMLIVGRIHDHRYDRRCHRHKGRSGARSHTAC